MSKKQFSFSKQEHLCSRKMIEKLFKSGKVINERPIKLLWTENKNEEKSLLQVAISVPKKNFKKAVDRNKIKRQIREAFRLNKHVFFSALENEEKKFACIIVFVGKQTLSANETADKILVTLHRFAKSVCEIK